MVILLEFYANETHYASSTKKRRQVAASKLWESQKI